MAFKNQRGRKANILQYMAWQALHRIHGRVLPTHVCCVEEDWEKGSGCSMSCRIRQSLPGSPEPYQHIALWSVWHNRTRSVLASWEPPDWTITLDNCVSISLPRISVSNYVYHRVLYLIKKLLQYTDTMLTPSVGGTMKFGQDRNRCSEKKYVTIPNSNCSESSEDSWLVSYYAHVPTKKAKLTPSLGWLGNWAR